MGELRKDGVNIKSLIGKMVLGTFAATLGAVLQGILWPWIGPSHFILFYPAVIVSSLLSGLYAGLATAIASIALAIYIFIPPVFSFSAEKFQEPLPFLIFLISGISISAIATKLQHRTQELAEEKFRESEERFRFMIEQSPLSIQIFDINGKTIKVSKSFEKLWGVSFDNLKNYNILQDRQLEAIGLMPYLKKSFAGEVAALPLKEYDATDTLGTGFKRLISATSYPVKDSLGRVINVVLIHEDVTERKQAEDALRESEQRMRTIVENEPECVKIIDSKGELLEMNHAGLAMLEAESLNEVKQHTLIAFINPEYRADFLALHERVLKGETDALEFEVTGLKGTRRWLETHAAPMKGPSGKIEFLLGITRDITGSKRAKTELIAAKEAAEKAALAKSRFLDIAAHELRTPVTSFSLIVQLAQKQLAKGRPVEASTLVRLRSQSERISRLVVDLLDVSRLERKGMSLHLEFKDIVSLTTECLNDFGLREPTRKVVFSPPQAPIKINMDTIRINQVISNFLDNAAKYTQEGSPIEVSIEMFPGRVRFSVKDYGPGIPDEQQAVMFMPFTRGTTEMAERAGGLGLGLYICRGIIELHGGTIGLESKMAIGSTFYFELPIPIEDNKL